MKKVLYFVIAGTVLSACNGREEDTMAPIIETLELSTDEVATGQNLEVETNVTDDRQLSQVKFDIHDRFDGHGHERPTGVPWEETRVVPVDGKGYLLIESFVPPVNATAGPYHVVVQVVDDAGNTGEFREADFWVTNSEQAVIQVTSPDLSIEPYFAIDDVLNFVGTITDNDELHEVTVKVTDFAGPVMYDQDIDLEGQGVNSFDLSTLPPIVFDEATWGSNHVTMSIEITAIDSDENISKIEGILHYN